jgi:hypothetical protein
LLANAVGQIRISQLKHCVRQKAGSYGCKLPGHLDPAATVDSSTRRALRSFQSSSSISISISISINGSADHLAEHKNSL